MTLPIVLWALALGAGAIEVQSPVSEAPTAPNIAPAVAPQALEFEVHPLLLGALSDPVSPVGLELTRQADELARLQKKGELTAERAAQYLAPLAQGSPVERSAAAIMARVVAEPDAAARVFKVGPELKDTKLPKLSGAAALPKFSVDDDAGMASLRALAIGARSDPYAKIVFDGFAPPSGFSNMQMTKEGPVWSEGALKMIGSGGFGMVHAHPTIDGAVLKTIFAPKGWGAETRRKMYEYAFKDEVAARALAQAGAGPRVLMHTDELGSPVLIKERVYGDTVHDLIHSENYGRAEHALVRELIARLAEARLWFDDFREPNIIIGHTRLDPSRRAYLIDGGEMVTISIGTRERALRRMIYRSDAHWVSNDEQGRKGVKHKPVNHILEEALVASGQADWLTRLKVAWRRWRGTDRPAFTPDEP